MESGKLKFSCISIFYQLLVLFLHGTILVIVTTESFEMIPGSEVLKKGLKLELYLSIVTTIANIMIQGWKSKKIIRFLEDLNEFDAKVRY